MVVVGGEGPCTGSRAHVGGGSSRERSPCDCHGGWGQWAQCRGTGKALHSATRGRCGDLETLSI